VDTHPALQKRFRRVPGVVQALGVFLLVGFAIPRLSLDTYSTVVLGFAVTVFAGAVAGGLVSLSGTVANEWRS